MAEGTPGPSRASRRSRQRYRGTPRRSLVALAVAAAALALVGLLGHGLDRLAARAPHHSPLPGGPAVLVEGVGVDPQRVKLRTGMSLCDVWIAGGGGGEIDPAECGREAIDGTRVSLEGGRFTVQELTPGERFAVGMALELNEASAPELEAVPGLSTTLAGRIVEEREQAPFCAVEELTRVRGIGARKLEWVRPFLQVSRSPAGCSDSP